MRRQGMTRARGLFAGQEDRGKVEMKTGTAKGILIAALVVGAAAASGVAAQEIKSGKWQFTTQMQIPASMTTSPAGGPGMTRTACVDAANPVPPETQQG